MNILVSALEPSSNLHLKEILKHTNLNIQGIFDESLGSPIIPSREFSVMGIVDVIPKILKAKKAIKKLAQMSLKCDKVLLIDAPAFNLPLAKAIKKLNPNIKIIYYILPKVWVWKKNRIKKIEKYCDEICSIFPFEDQFYTRSKYIGNPILDEITKFKTNTKTDKIAFLPGSRKSEIKSLIQIYKNVAKKLNKKSIIVIPPHFTQSEIDELYGDLSQFEIVKEIQEALLQSDFAYICSGTASLEAAIIGVPSIIVYRAKKIDFFIAKLFIKLKYIGLANIIFDFEGLKPMQREFLQEDVNEQNLINEYENRDDMELFLNKSKKLQEILHSGSANNIIAIIAS